MLPDQHTLTTLGTARILSRNAATYADYLQDVLGRAFVLANPVESHGPMRLKARFVTDKAASGEKDGPFIELWIEFNPAMGLYTVTGNYFVPPNMDTPAYTSSPRSGYDDEMLADPFRLFDWLRPAANGFDPYFEQALESMVGMQTPAGPLQTVRAQSEAIDGGEICVLQLEPEYRIPQDYYVSGTSFPGPTDTMPRAANLPHVWQVDYQMPIQSAVQTTLDRLYGEGAFDVEVDTEGYVFVTGLKPVPSQDGRRTTNMPPPMALPAVESKAWYTSELLRMAGVDGSPRMADRYLSESAKQKKAKEKDKADKKAKKGKYKNTNTDLRAIADEKFPKSKKKADRYFIGILRNAGLGKRRAAAKANEDINSRMAALLSEEDEPMNTRISRYLETLAAKLEAVNPRMEGSMCEKCGCEMTEAEAKDAGDGEMLCESCREGHVAEAKEKGVTFDPRKAMIYFDLTFEDFNLEDDQSSDDPSNTLTAFNKLGKRDDDRMLAAERAAMQEIEARLKKTGLSIRMGNEGHDNAGNLVMKFGVNTPEEAKKVADVVSRAAGGGDDAIYLDAPYMVAQGFRLYPQGVNKPSFQLVDTDEWMGESSQYDRLFALAEGKKKPAAKSKPKKEPTAYEKLLKSLKKRDDVEDPKALAAWIGRKKLGDEEFQKRAMKGKKAAAKARKSK